MLGNKIVKMVDFDLEQFQEVPVDEKKLSLVLLASAWYQENEVWS